MTRNFILGEEKYIDIQVKSQWRKDFLINTATWELLDSKGQKVAGNSCEINDNILSCLVAPPSKGTFTLEVSYYIAPEKRKIRIPIKVD